jgi:hypothetical protein
MADARMFLVAAFRAGLVEVTTAKPKTAVHTRPKSPSMAGSRQPSAKYSRAEQLTSEQNRTEASRERHTRPQNANMAGSRMFLTAALQAGLVQKRTSQSTTVQHTVAQPRNAQHVSEQPSKEHDKIEHPRRTPTGTEQDRSPQNTADQIASDLTSQEKTSPGPIMLAEEGTPQTFRSLNEVIETRLTNCPRDQDRTTGHTADNWSPEVPSTEKICDENTGTSQNSSAQDKTEHTADNLSPEVPSTEKSCDENTGTSQNESAQDKTEHTADNLSAEVPSTEKSCDENTGTSQNESAQDKTEHTADNLSPEQLTTEVPSTQHSCHGNANTLKNSKVRKAAMANFRHTKKEINKFLRLWGLKNNKNAQMKI